MRVHLRSQEIEFSDQRLIFNFLFGCLKFEPVTYKPEKPDKHNDKQCHNDSLNNKCRRVEVLHLISIPVHDISLCGYTQSNHSNKRNNEFKQVPRPFFASEKARQQHEIVKIGNHQGENELCHNQSASLGPVKNVHPALEYTYLVKIK